MDWNEESDISLDRIAVALELVAKSLDKIANPMVQTTNELAPLGFTRCTTLLIEKGYEKKEDSNLAKTIEEGEAPGPAGDATTSGNQ